MHGRLDHATGVEVERLLEILAGADERTTDRQRLEHDLEDGPEVPGGRPLNTMVPPLRHADGLAERRLVPR